MRVEMMTESKPTVKTPSRKRILRKGSGFSLEEVRKSNKSIEEIKAIGIKIDYRRITLHDANIEILNNIKIESKKKDKREPFKKKVKIPKKPKKKKVVKEEVPEPVKKEVKKEVKKPAKKPVKKPTTKEGIKLTVLDKLGPTTEKKLIEIGITDVESLCKEDPKEVALLVQGCSEEKLSKWIEEGKKILEDK